jgi:exosortase A
VAVSTAYTPDTVSSRSRIFLLFGVLSLGLFVYAYRDTFLWLYERYTNPDSHYSHGFLIPLVSGWLIWRKRDELRGMTISGSGIGLILMVLALLLHVGSVWTHVFFTSGFSIQLFIVGACLYLFGTAITKKIAFPLGFLAFMFPLPMGVISAFSFPLKLLVADLGALAMKALGVSLYREGAIISLTNASLSVGDPCSGIRSLISLLALGALIAHMSAMTMPRKIALFFMAIPIAIFTNVLRVCALILVADRFGSMWASPEHWFHTASGMGVFVVSMILLFLTMKVLEGRR